MAINDHDCMWEWISLFHGSTTVKNDKIKWYTIEVTKLAVIFHVSGVLSVFLTFANGFDVFSVSALASASATLVRQY